jgi:hypothetical protein
VQIWKLIRGSELFYIELDGFYTNLTALYQCFLTCVLREISRIAAEVLKILQFSGIFEKFEVNLKKFTCKERRESRFDFL